MYKLIAIDMDGTLLNSDKQISSRTFQTIQNAKTEGIKVVLASGRPLEGIMPHLEKLNLTSNDDFVISYNGSIVQRVGSEEILHQRGLCGLDAKLLLNIASDLNVYIHAFSPLDGLITNKHNKWTDIESSVNKITISEKDFSLLEDQEPLVKIMMIAEPSRIENAIKNLPKYLKEKYTVVRSAPFFLEFLHIESNKGIAVACLADILKLTPNEIMCIGDAENDHHMLKYAGLGVAMSNADIETQNIADYIAPTNDEDGVAVAIEIHALKNMDLIKQ